MNCFYHPSEVAVSACSDCGKGLCSRCASFFNPPICSDCARARNENIKKEAVKKLAFLVGAVVIANIIGFNLAKDIGQGGVSGVLGLMIASGILGLFVAGIPSGWRVLNKITPDIFLILPLVGWVIYFVIKGFISFFIGGFVLIIQLVKAIIQISKYKKNNKYINSMNK